MAYRRDRRDRASRQPALPPHSPGALTRAELFDTFVSRTVADVPAPWSERLDRITVTTQTAALEEGELGALAVVRQHTPADRSKPPMYRVIVFRRGHEIRCSSREELEELTENSVLSCLADIFGVPPEQLRRPRRR